METMSTDDDGGRGTPTPPVDPGSPAVSVVSCAGGAMLPPSSPVSREQLQKRIESLSQQNRVLKCELETYKLRVKSLQEENRHLRQASVHIQAKAEQEEEFISNTLLKKIQALKKEKENLALNYEQEEECLTNDLSRKLDQLRQEKVQLEHTLEQEQECLVNKLMRRIEKLETETTTKQTSLDNLRREKVELENTLEQEQEALVNKLWKRMDQLETEKRSLQVRLDKPVSEPESPRTLNDYNNGQASGADTAANLANNIRALKQECARLKQQLVLGKQEHEQKMAAYAKEEREIREENLRLQRRLQLEMERREALCRHLSESESSLEMEEERVYNESIHNPTVVGASLPPSGAVAAVAHRTRTMSSPVPAGIVSPAGAAASVPPPTTSRPLSPGLNYGEQKTGFTPPSISSSVRLHNVLTTPPGVVPSPSPPPPPPSAGRRSLPGAGVQVGSTATAPNFVRPNHPLFTPVQPPPNSTSTSTSTPTLSSSNAVVNSAVAGNVSMDKRCSQDDKPPASPMDTSDSTAGFVAERRLSRTSTPVNDAS